MNIGKKWEAWVARNGRENDKLLLFRFNDSHSFGGTHFRHPPPCDFIGIFNKHPIAIECKATRHKSFPISALKKHQLHSLRLFESHGGVALVVFLIDGHITMLKPSEIPVRGSIKKSNTKIIWKHNSLGGHLNEKMDQQF